MQILSICSHSNEKWPPNNALMKDKVIERISAQSRKIRTEKNDDTNVGIYNAKGEEGAVEAADRDVCSSSAKSFFVTMVGVASPMEDETDASGLVISSGVRSFS